MAGEIARASGPLLLLLRNLALAAGSSPALAARPVRLRALELTPAGLAATLDVRGLNALVDGSYRAELTLLASGSDRTQCTVKLTEEHVRARLVNLGLKLAPNWLLNELVKGRWGGALRFEGDRLVVEHGPLLDWLLPGAQTA
jgi:hypothetical protein